MLKGIEFYLLCSSVGKNSACNGGDPSSIPGLGRSHGDGIGDPLQYSWASLLVQLGTNLYVIQETWIQSLGWEDPLGRDRLLTPVFWPGEFHELYSPWGHEELTGLSDFHYLKPVLRLSRESSINCISKSIDNNQKYKS